MNEIQPNRADSEQVIVALEGDAGNLDKLVTVARECGFRKLLSALVKDLQKLRLSDDDIPPATATLCRWHAQPRPRPPKPRSFSTSARGPRHAPHQNHRPRYTFKPA